MFNKRLFFVVLVVLSLLIGGTFAQAADQIILKLGHVGSATDPRQDAGMLFASLVEMKTNGQVKVEVYPSGMLGTWEEMIGGLELGSTDIVIESVGCVESYSNLACIETLPFLFRDTGHFLKIWESPLGKEILDKISQETGFLFLGHMYRGARHLTAVRPVEKLADLEGLKIRVPPLDTYIQIWEKLGASPTPMAWTEVFTALQQKVIDAQENPLDVIRFNSIYEAAPYLTLTGHILGNYYFIFWDDTFEQFPDNVQEAIKEAANEVSSWFTLNTFKAEEQNLTFIEENGGIIIKLGQEELEKWKDKVSKIVESKDEIVQKWAQEIGKVK